MLRAWGAGDAGTVAHAKAQFELILREYVASRDAACVEHALAVLRVPFFHHEFVKRLLTLAISTPPAADGLLSLLAHVSASQQVERARSVRARAVAAVA